MTGPLSPRGGLPATTMTGVWAFAPPSVYATAIAARISASHPSSSAASSRPRLTPAAWTDSASHRASGLRKPRIAAAPLVVEPVDGVLVVRRACRLEDPEHPVRERATLLHCPPFLFGDSRRQLALVTDLEAVGTPRQRQVPVRGDLAKPAGRDPRPRARRVNEDFDAGHDWTIGATRAFTRRGGEAWRANYIADDCALRHVRRWLNRRRRQRLRGVW